MKSCELCKLAATTSCESDQASLCWDCDAVVHGANFLVARHVRCLLCHACQSLTPMESHWFQAWSHDNQVVPWSTVANTPPPAPSSSSSDNYSGGEREVSRSTNLFSLKRSRGNASDLHSEDDPDRLSSKRRYGYHTVVATRCRAEGGGVSVDSRTMRLSKDQQIKPEGTVQLQSESRGATSTESLGKN
ncbi:hypothetical protein GOBAR_DD34352 [Gossypium barbadense]|nr:hypothetical protein GOBAR_DD34352 [Gossypium barbadense]